jgi:hypothetical protein
MCVPGLSFSSCEMQKESHGDIKTGDVFHLHRKYYTLFDSTHLCSNPFGLYHHFSLLGIGKFKRKNNDSLMQENLWDQLLFKDCAFVARRLGLEYL